MWTTQSYVRKMRLLPLSLAAFIAGCGDCTNNPLALDASPDDEYLAISYTRLCGPDSRATTNVSIMQRPGHLVNKPGNTFVADGEHSIAMKWLDARTIELEISQAGMAKKQESEIDGIEVRYLK